MSGIRHLVAATLAATVALGLFAVTNRALAQEFRFRADVAANNKPDPNFLNDVKILPGGAKGNYLQCGNNQLLSYWAPGNIYAQRGTLSFFWRSRMPVDETEFPVFRVGYGDHSSWDMVWLRIDYNGHGFDAFVTDVNLGRTRVSVPLNECTGTCVTFWTGDIVYKPLAAKVALVAGFRRALPVFRYMIVVAVAVVMWESRQGFPRGGGRVESRHYGFPCFPRPGISMACLWSPSLRDVARNWLIPRYWFKSKLRDCACDQFAE
jgi:hypothetical protein